MVWAIPLRDMLIFVFGLFLLLLLNLFGGSKGRGVPPFDVFPLHLVFFLLNMRVILMKTIAFRSSLLVAVIGVLGGLPQANAAIIADAAGDYLAAAGGPTTALTTPPSGWSYLGSTAANGGTETALTAGQVGNQSAAYQGFVGSSTAGTASVYGTNTADPNEYEIFSNGDPNLGVVGRDLLLHPGQGGNADEFVIVRYTISAAEANSSAGGNGAIEGSFRDLIVGGNAARESVSVEVFQNNTSLFTTAGGTTAQTTPGILLQTAGTFNLTGLTFAENDTIDFVVGINGHFGADETALQATISVPEPATLALLALGCVGFVAWRQS